MKLQIIHLRPQLLNKLLQTLAKVMEAVTQLRAEVAEVQATVTRFKLGTRQGLQDVSRLTNAVAQHVVGKMNSHLWEG